MLGIIDLEEVKTFEDSEVCRDEGKTLDIDEELLSMEVSEKLVYG